MNIGKPVKQITRSYRDAIKNAASGRFTLRQLGALQAKKSTASSPRTIYILETRASRLRNRRNHS